MAIWTLTTNYNQVYGKTPLRILTWRGRGHLSVFSTTLSNRSEYNSSSNSQADLARNVKQRPGWWLGDRGRLLYLGSNKGEQTVHGVWGVGCQEGVGSKPKDKECKSRRKKGSEHTCWELFKKIQLLFISFTVQLRRLRSRKDKLH